MKLTAYDSRDRVTTEYSKAVGWGHSDKTLPRHGGGCRPDHLPPYYGLGNRPPKWLIEAESERRNAIWGEWAKREMRKIVREAKREAKKRSRK
jgi:hypothetical protein